MNIREELEKEVLGMSDEQFSKFLHLAKSMLLSDKRIYQYPCLVEYLGQFTRNYTQTTKRGLLTTNKG